MPSDLVVVSMRHISKRHVSKQSLSGKRASAIVQSSVKHETNWKSENFTDDLVTGLRYNHEVVGSKFTKVKRFFVCLFVIPRFLS